VTDERDLYGLLGVSRSASDDDIKKAYRSLARKLHPDLNPGDADAEQRFKEVSAAYDVLSDPKLRALYDEFGEAGLGQGFDPEQARAYQQYQQRRSASGAQPGDVHGFDLEDLEELFGGRFSRSDFSAGFPRRGRDLAATVEISLREALQGTEVSLQAPNRVGTATGPVITVRIPKGAAHGDRLTVKGKGLSDPRGGPPGDLIIETLVRKHEHFRREGLHLHLTLPVALAEAYNGGTVDVPTPDGNVKLKIPPGSQSGSRLRLKDKGVLRGKQRGDLYVELRVMLPDQRDETLAAALDAASSLYSTPVRQGIAL
jgi:DnaJ-class molecular chaperone